MEQTTPLQLGHYEAHEVLIGTWDVGGGEHKAIAGLTREPLLEPIRDLLWGADEERQFVQRTTPTVGDEIARARIALAAETDDTILDSP
jgi:hypothetical protein